MQITCFVSFGIAAEALYCNMYEQNILLSTNDESAVLKIADFGFAK